MAHGYGGGNGDWSPPPPPSNRGDSGGRRRAPEPSDDGWVRKPPVPEPGPRGAMGHPRGGEQPPAPPPGRRRSEPSHLPQKPDYPGYPGSVSGVPGAGSPAGPPPPRGARGGNRQGGPRPGPELSSSGFPKRRRQDVPPDFPSSASAPPGTGPRPAPGYPASASAPPGTGSRQAPGYPASASAPPGTGSRQAPGYPASASAPPGTGSRQAPGGLVNAPRSGGQRTSPAPVGAPRGAMPNGRNAPAGLADPRKMPPRPTRPGALPPNGPVSPPPAGPAQRGAPAARPRPTGEGQSRWQQRVHLNPHMSKRWRAILGVIGVIVVLSVCGLSSWLIVLDEQKGVQAQANNATPKPSFIPVDISSREVDPTPLTVAEVFPNDKIIIDPSKPNEAYSVIAKQELTDCRSSTKGEISALIQGLGCSQVIRATMRSPSDYLVTGGIFNLDTVASAEKAWESIRGMVDSQKGGFVGYAPASDKTARPLVLAATVVGWNMKGHYLAFCVIARADGNEIPDRDPFASQIMYDIVEIYLKGQILEARATDPAPGASGAPAPTPSG
jgi:hypothetical protein